MRSESLSGMCAKLHTMAASNNRDHMPWSLYIACPRHIHVVLFSVHILFVVNSAMPTKRLQQHPLLFFNEPHQSHILLWRCHMAQPSHPGHSTFLLQLESPSGMWSKLHTVAATNNRNHTPQSLCYCLSAPHIYGVALRAHSICGELRIQHNANLEVATLLNIQPHSVMLRLLCTQLWYYSTMVRG